MHRRGNYAHWAALLFVFAGRVAGASGLEDLRSALDRLEGRALIVAELQAEVWNAAGEGKDRFETEGVVAITLNDGEDGFGVHYDNEILRRIDAERQVLAKDPDMPTPTLEALREFTPDRLQSMVSAAPRLRRTIDRSRFRAERPADYDGKPARLLEFEQDISTVSRRDRKYVNDFQSLLEVWIDADGTPLASRSRLQLKGSIFIFIRFRHREEEDAVYGSEAGRLVTLRRETSSASSGGGESREGRALERLRLGQTKPL